MTGKERADKVREALSHARQSSGGGHGDAALLPPGAVILTAEEALWLREWAATGTEDELAEALALLGGGAAG